MAKKKVNSDLPYYIDNFSMTQLMNSLDENKDDEIEISWNSLGGSVYAGQQFADYLNNKDFKLTANVSGIAASMGASLLGFFDHVKGAAQADIMIHSASGGSKETLKNTNLFLYEALKKKINEDVFEQITGKKLKNVMLAEGDDRVNVWFTGKDAKKMGLFDEVYDLLSPKNNALELPTSEIGYSIPDYIKDKYNHKKIDNKMEIKDLTLAKLQVENPDLYNSIFNAGKEAERKRVIEINNYTKYDFEKANELIKGGQNLSISDVEHFMEKKFNAQTVENLEKTSNPDLNPAKVTKNREVNEKEQALNELNAELGLTFDKK